MEFFLRAIELLLEMSPGVFKRTFNIILHNVKVWRRGDLILVLSFDPILRQWERTRRPRTQRPRTQAQRGKGKGGKAADGLGTCTYVKARHILCEKQGKINEAYKKLQDGWLSNGDKVPPAEFAKVAQEYSECPSGKKGGDLGWFPRGKMAGPFQEVAFNTPVGVTSAPFKSTHGYHIILSEGRKN
ncbi:hypothetical protein CMV_012883 [Castanea mollissima]|uniref:Peptidyl-prolyl cis-trans isomerase n=1 Tax=Castanea mollissima TaxID=60419 RepID=A0A8J4RE01_9ROSI|nr:hypothetical protein CMV_012883 [Castanea mollissima]